MVKLDYLLSAAVVTVTSTSGTLFISYDNSGSVQQQTVFKVSYFCIC